MSYKCILHKQTKKYKIMRKMLSIFLFTVKNVQKNFKHSFRKACSKSVMHSIIFVGNGTCKTNNLDSIAFGDLLFSCGTNYTAIAVAVWRPPIA